MGYQLEGRMLEVCNCNAICPCWFGEDPTTGTCDTVIAWHIDKGMVNGEPPLRGPAPPLFCPGGQAPVSSHFIRFISFAFIFLRKTLAAGVSRPRLELGTC